MTGVQTCALPIFHDRVGRARRRHEDHRGVGPGFLHGLRDCVEDRHSAIERLLPTAPRRHAADHLSAVRQALLRMERTGLARDALADESSLFVDENAHVVDANLRKDYDLSVMRCAKIKFHSDEVCAEAIHEISRHDQVTMLRGDYFIIPESAVAWLDSQKISYELVEWMNQDEVVQTLRDTLTHQVQ